MECGWRRFVSPNPGKAHGGYLVAAGSQRIGPDVRDEARARKR